MALTYEEQIAHAEGAWYGTLLRLFLDEGRDVFYSKFEAILAYESEENDVLWFARRAKNANGITITDNTRGAEYTVLLYL